MKNIIFLKRKQRQNGDPRIKSQKPIDTQDEKLLSLQKYLSLKISKTKDENLIRHYLRQCQEIAEERLQLQKEVQQCM